MGREGANAGAGAIFRGGVGSMAHSAPLALWGSGRQLYNCICGPFVSKAEDPGKHWLTHLKAWAALDMLICVRVWI